MRTREGPSESSRPSHPVRVSQAESGPWLPAYRATARFWPGGGQKGIERRSKRKESGQKGSRTPPRDSTARMLIRRRSSASKRRRKSGQTAVKRRSTAVKEWPKTGDSRVSKRRSNSGSNTAVKRRPSGGRRRSKSGQNGGQAAGGPAEVVGGEAEPVRLPEDGQVPPRQPAKPARSV